MARSGLRSPPLAACRSPLRVRLAALGSGKPLHDRVLTHLEAVSRVHLATQPQGTARLTSSRVNPGPLV
jgi:hypothetical protein